MKNYIVKITGKTPLLMHADNIEWADRMDAWKNDPANKKISRAGDDRSPAWRWVGSCYHDNKVLAIPQANIMRCLMEGGAMVPVPGGRSGKSFKSQTQSGMMCVEPYWPLRLANGSTVDWLEILHGPIDDDFAKQQEKAHALGFRLNVKRAKIGTSKHIRVRPEFDAGWSCSGTMNVWDEQITEAVLASILEYSGNYKGLCDWRPGGRTPGPYGTFTAQIELMR